MKLLKNMCLFLVVPVILAFTTLDLLSNKGSCEVNRENNTTANTDLEQLPAFEVKLLDSGKTFDSGNLNGNYTLIDVWSPSCGICVKHIPSLQKLNEKYSDKNFEMVSIALSTEEKVQQFRKEKYPMPWKHALAERSRDGEIVQALEVKSTPTYYFVSPEGEVLATNDDFKQADGFDEVISKYL